MHQLLLRLEPIIWLLFGQGILLGTILLTGWILVIGLLIPMGIVPLEAIDFQRAHALASNPIGRLLLFGLIALPMWKGAHHIRSLSLDMGGVDRDGLVAGLLYSVAILGSIAAFVAVIRL